jgi:hypothetical protein
MRQTTILRILLASLLSPVLAPVSISSGEHPQTNGEIKGTVFDVNEAVISDAMLTFRDEAGEEKVKTSQDGTYSVRLKSGIYTLAVSHAGFCRARRSAFVLESGLSVKFDIHLYVQAMIDPIAVEPIPLYGEAVGAPTTWQACGDLKYEELGARQPSASGAVVLFGSRSESGGNIIYSGAESSGKHVGISFTLNRNTVTSESLTYTPAQHLIRAEGNVEWSDGKNKKHGSFVEISRLDSIPLIRMSE